MILPLKLLIKEQGNMYEMTCATIKRAIQLNITGDSEIEQCKGKVVSLAIKQILTSKVHYRLEEK